MDQKLTEAEGLFKLRNQYSSNLLKPGYILDDLLSLHHLRRHGLEDTQCKTDFFEGIFHQMKSVGQLPTGWVTVSSHARQKSWWDNRSNRQQVVKMHETEVHVFSETSFCLGHSAMASSEVKIAERWKVSIEYYKDTAKNWLKQLQYTFHNFLAPGQTRLCSQSLNEFDSVSTSKEETTVMIEVWLVAPPIANTSRKLNVKCERIVRSSTRKTRRIQPTEPQRNRKGNGKESDEDKERWRLRLRILQIIGLAVWNFQKHPLGSRGKHSETNFRLWAFFQQVGKTEDAQLHHWVTLLLWTYLLCLVLCTVSFSSCTLSQMSTVFQHFGHVCVMILRVIWDFVWSVHRTRPSSTAFVRSKTARARAGHWLTLIFLHHSLEEVFVEVVCFVSCKFFLIFIPLDQLIQRLCLHAGEDYRERLDDTHQSKDVQSRHWRFVTCDLSRKDKNTIRQSSNIQHVQTANSIVVSDTSATVHVKELGAFLQVHRVEDSPSVPSLWTLCNDLGYSDSWRSGETPRLSNCKRWSSALSKTSSPWWQLPTYKCSPSVGSSSSKGNSKREAEVEDAMLDVSELFTEGVEEDDGLLSTIKARGAHMHGIDEQPLEDKLPSVVTDAGGDTLARETKSKKGTIGSQPTGNHTVFTLYLTDPMCWVWKMSTTTQFVACNILRDRCVDIISCQPFVSSATQHMFVTECACTNGIVKLFGRPRLSRTAEEKARRCWNLRWQFINRHLSEEFWGVDSEYKVPGLVYRASSRVQVRSWETDRDPTDNQATQYLAWSSHAIHVHEKEDKLKNGHNEAPNCKQHAATKESTRCWPTTKIISRWLLIVVRNWKNTTLVLPCIGREDSRGKPLSYSTLIDASTGQWDSRHEEHAEKWSENAWITLPKQGTWEEISLWPGT